MPNRKLDAERAAQLARLRAALAARPELREDRDGLAAAAGVPVNRTTWFLAHLDDPVLTLQSVHRLTGLDRKTIEAHAEAADLSLVDLRMQQIDDSEVARLYVEERLSLRDIARRTGWSSSGISHALARAGVATRRPGAGATVPGRGASKP